MITKIFKPAAHIIVCAGLTVAFTRTVPNLHASVQVVTVAGTGQQGYSGDNGPSLNAAFNNPSGMAFDAAGNLYVADTGNNVIRKIDVNGLITTVAGNGSAGYDGDWGPATSAKLNGPMGVAADADGSIYIADTNNNRIRKVMPGGTIYTLTGDGRTILSGDGWPAVNGSFNAPVSLAVNSGGDVLVADSGNHAIRRVSKSGVLARVAGTGSVGMAPDNSPALAAPLSSPRGLFVDSAGTIYFSDYGNNRICKITPDGTFRTVAGIGTNGYTGDGGFAYSAVLSAPMQVSGDANNNLYFTDQNNHAIRKISRNGSMTTLAGTGTNGKSVNAVPARSAQFSYPSGLAVSPANEIYISDSANHTIRKLVTTPIPLSPAFDSAGNNETFINADLIDSYDYFVPAGSAGIDRITITGDYRASYIGARVMSETVGITLQSGAKSLSKTALFTFRLNKPLLERALGSKSPDVVRMAYLDNGQWIVMPDTKLEGTEIKVRTNYAGQYAVTFEGPSSNLSSVKAYPNPVNFSGNKNINFDGLTENASVRIYDLDGGPIQTLTAEYGTGSARWDGRNRDGSTVSAGTYIYLIEDNVNHKLTGKIGVKE